MGLDLALGVVILIAAFRGWLQGFAHQAIRIGALVASVYGAGYVRNYAKPYVQPYLSSIRADLVDRLLWWVVAVLTYLVLVGIASLVAKMTRRPEIPGISQSGRNDQFAGFFVGIVKGVLLACFMAAGIQNYAMDQVKSISWGEEQAKASWALKWNEAFQPARKIWTSRPVQHFVNHIKRMGLLEPGDAAEAPLDSEVTEEGSVRTASRPAQDEGDGKGRSTGQSDSPAQPSTSSTPLPAEAPESATEKNGNQARVADKPAVDDAN